MTPAVWKAIGGYEGQYEVSSRGEIRSLDRIMPHGVFRRGRPMRTKRDRNGYLTVGLRAHGVQKTLKVHRIVLDAFYGPCPPGHLCGHFNGIRDDNRIENLAWITPKENIRHMDEVHFTRKARRGEEVHFSKLCASDVIRIREASVFGAKRADLAKVFGIDRATVRLILIGKNWSHLHA